MCYNMNEPWKYCDDKSQTEKETYISTYMTYLKQVN